VPREELPKALVKWYDYTKWVLDRVDGFPKNQRFVLGTWPAPEKVDGSKVEFWGVEGRQNEHEEESIQ